MYQNFHFITCMLRSLNFLYLYAADLTLQFCLQIDRYINSLCIIRCHTTHIAIVFIAAIQNTHMCAFYGVEASSNHNNYKLLNYNLKFIIAYHFEQLTLTF